MTEIKSMSLLPHAPGKCVECAAVHAPEEPHDKRSLYYQMRFAHIHGRFPTWADAMEHCTTEAKAVWCEELRKLGVEVTP